MARPALAGPLVVVALVSGCGSPARPAPPPAPAVATGSAPVPVAPGPKPVAVTLASVGLDPDALDRKADACTDFYRFACGGWLDKNQIPADKPVYARSLNEAASRR